MQFATTQEMEYVGSNNGEADIDRRIIDEMSRQLDALRRFDQYCAADWQPQRCRGTSKIGLKESTF
jgi:hypothetical protein